MNRRRSSSPLLLRGTVLAVFVVVVAAGVLTNTTLRTVEKNLPDKLLAQLYDLETILEHLAALAVSAELARAAPGEAHFAQMRSSIQALEAEVVSLRDTYVLDNLVQASAFHAIVAPAVADARIWLEEGVSGFAPQARETVAIVTTRIETAYRKARAQQRTSQLSARQVLVEQAARLNRFLLSVNLLFGVTLAMSLLMVILLVRQDILQHRERQAQDERHRAEEALRQSEQRFRQLAELLPQTVFEIDRDGRLTFVNDYGAGAFGYAAGDFEQGLHLVELFAPQEHDAVQKRIAQLLQGLTRPPGERYTAVRKDGGTFPVLMFTSEVRQGEKITGLRGIITDITEQVRLQDERDRLEAQYSQAQKMEAVGRLAGGLAHDLNNLLAPIIGYGELLLNDIAPGDSKRRPVETIHQAGTRARDLIRQILAFSRKQALAVRPVDLNRVVEGFYSLLRRTIREDVEIRTALVEDLPPIQADAGQIEQVLLNLAVNAQDAMPDGGRLSIETAAIDLDEGHPALSPAGTPGRHVMLAVRDTGRGMDAETQDRIFEPFFTTKDKSKGSGLGLSMVFGIVRQHGGSIEVDSHPGDGAIFRCYFPCAETALPARIGPAGPPPDTQGSGKILVVEDSDEVRQLAVTILMKNGYTVIAAASGADCLEQLGAHPGPIDLMLTDVVMPDTNGKALFEQVVRRCPGMRVLYMSGYTDNAIVHHGVLDEGVAFIQKPFAVRDLVAKVRAVLAR